MKNIILVLLFISVGSCQPTSNEDNKETEDIQAVGAHHSKSIQNVFEAHGGFEAWSNQRQLTFERGGEKHVVELQSRKVRIEAADWTIGSDGSDVWISPLENSYKGDPRFFHNLYFYFFSMPFVVGDPGVFYEELEDREILGVNYGAVQISYDAGVGDSPKDNYIVYYDKVTNKMAWLMYTVTFRSQESSENFSLIKYEDWKDISGVVLPSKLVWYVYKDGVVGAPRREVIFENITLSTGIPENALFVIPPDGKIVE